MARALLEYAVEVFTILGNTEKIRVAPMICTHNAS